MLTPLGYELPRVLTPSRAARFGISRSRVRTELRRGAWRRLSTGLVLTSADEPSRFDWAEAGLALGGPASALSGWDALVLHGLRTKPSSRAPVLVLVRTGRSRRVGPVLIRRTARPYSAEFTPLEHPVSALTPLVNAARAVADACLLPADLDQVRAVVARTIQTGLCTPEQLNHELSRCPRNGSGRLRQALGEIGAGARSVAEAHALRQLRGSRLPEFEVNVAVLGGDGDVCYVVDVLWRRLRAVLEIDGREFHFDSASWHATLRRHNLLTAAGLSVTHYPPSRIMSADDTWLGELAAWLRARAGELNVPYLPASARRPAPAPNPPPLLLPELDQLWNMVGLRPESAVDQGGNAA